MIPKATPPLCKDCIHCDKSIKGTYGDPADRIYWFCKVTAIIDLRDGEVTMQDVFSERYFSSEGRERCGTKGLNFEPITPITPASEPISNPFEGTS